MKLSIIIVSYKVKYYLEQCLLSVRRAVEGIDAEVIVIDNHSEDGTVDYISTRFPEIKVIASTNNLGFSKANNKAIRQSKGDYVLLLNPDTVVGEDVLRRCVQFMDEHERAGGLGVRMLQANGSDARESRRGLPTPMTSFYKMTGLCKRFPQNKVFGKYYMGYLSWDVAAKIEVISGAFCMLRRQTLNEVGLLDEDFFMYGEDIDLSFRILKGEWENWYLPLKILHYKGESTQKTHFRYVHVFYQAMLIFLRKHYGNQSFLLNIPIRLGIFLKAMLALIGMSIEQIRYNLGFVKNKRRDNVLYLCDVRSENKQKCKTLLENHGLRAIFINNSEERENSASETERKYKVYDITKYTFKEIFDQMSNETDCRLYMAFYNPNNMSIITDTDIIR